MLDVIAGDVPCENDPAFRPKDLFATWESRDRSLSNIDIIDSTNGNDAAHKKRKRHLKRKYGFMEPPKMRLGSVLDFVLMLIISSIFFPVGVPMGLYVESKRKSLRWRYGSLIGCSLSLLAIFTLVPFFIGFFPSIAWGVPLPTFSDNLFLLLSLFVCDLGALSLFIALVVLYYKRNNGGTSIIILLSFYR
jgi:hypothetical protein